jgi:predicted dehydrogenase
MASTNRREFMHTTGLGLAGAAALHWTTASAKAAGANQRLRVALMGCGGRGRYDCGLFAARDDVEIAYVCDPHQERLAEAARQFATARAVDDIRRVLDDPSVDAVINATPVHWHAPGSILACEAGKHVYVEKPCSHNLREGRLLVEAARRNNRVVQHGTQVRSTSTIREGVRLLADGAIGEVLMAKAWNIQRREGVGPGRECDPPAALDYELWLGPVPQVPYRDSFFGGWNWRRIFGTGEIGNDGVHDIDYARWGLGVETHPSRIAAVGGRYFFDNGAEFPDTQQVCFEYAPSGSTGHRRVLIYEERLWSNVYPHNCDSGAEFYGTEGQMFLSRRGKLEIVRGGNQRQKLDVPLIEQNTEAHVADFIDAIRSGRRANADAEVAHLTTSLCHLGNIAIQTGQTLQFDPPSERFVDAPQADTLLARTYRDNHWAVPQGV